MHACHDKQPSAIVLIKTEYINLRSLLCIICASRLEWRTQEYQERQESSMKSLTCCSACKSDHELWHLLDVSTVRKLSIDIN